MKSKGGDFYNGAFLRRPVWQERMTITDTCYHHLKPHIVVCRILGIFLFRRTKNGEYVTKLCSTAILYSICLYTAISYCSYKTLIITVAKKKREKSVLGFFVSTSQLLFHPLPLILFIEQKKVRELLMYWLKFQKNFLRLTGTELKIPCEKVKLFLWSAQTVIIILYVSFGTLLYPTAPLYSRVSVSFYVWFPMFLSSFWYILLYYIHRGASAIHCLVKGILTKKTTGVTLGDVHLLWIKLYRIMKMTGYSLSYTLSVFMLLNFFVVIMMIYEMVRIDLRVNIVNTVFFLFWTFISLFHLTSIPIVSQLTARKLGDDLCTLLQDLKIKGDTRESAQEIDAMMQDIWGNQISIDLGGFVTLDNSLITSMMNTIFTYLIVLIQFNV